MNAEMIIYLILLVIIIGGAAFGAFCWIMDDGPLIRIEGDDDDSR